MAQSGSGSDKTQIGFKPSKDLATKKIIHLGSFGRRAKAKKRSREEAFGKSTTELRVNGGGMDVSGAIVTKTSLEGKAEKHIKLTTPGDSIP
jgi:hypothetical protein